MAISIGSCTANCDGGCRRTETGVNQKDLAEKLRKAGWEVTMVESPVYRPWPAKCPECLEKEKGGGS